MKSESDLMALRHSLAHLLAQAVLELYPNAKPAIGPAIDNGFYYDFELDPPINEESLIAIETKMKTLIKNWGNFTNAEKTEAEAKEIYHHNPYKLELIGEIIDRGEKITFYEAGGFSDLCRGGHADNLSTIDPASFKLDRLAGAYWRGDEKNKMLTRIYGLAFNTKEELASFLNQREEAEKRDHRKLGKELGLFTFSDLVGAGLPLFTPKGTLIRQLIIDKIQSIQTEYGYEPVCIPHITKKDLYEVSGHWDKFKDDLFHVKGMSDTAFVMKPMNCPHHTQIYASKMRSYKELPLRFSETTMVYRDEQAGELLGLARVRSITQDDGHVFCTPEQMETEIKNIIQVIKRFYTSLDMFKEGNYWVSLSVRDPKQPEKSLGNEANWNKAESVLENIAQAEGLNYQRVEGEAAFYGPKLDFMFKDSLGRERQLATAQLDFVMPERFGLKYINNKGESETPVMIHRAIAGSLERFMAIMIEHFNGAFPVWLAPVQVKIIPIGEKQLDYAKEIYQTLKTNKLRVEIDLSDESLGKKVRNAKQEKIPYLVILGDKELTNKNITVESRDTGESTQMKLEDFLEKIK